MTDIIPRIIATLLWTIFILWMVSGATSKRLSRIDHVTVGILIGLGAILIFIGE